MWLDGLENRTVSIYVTRIRTLLRYAREKKLYSGSLHLEFRPKFKGLGKKDVYYLEWEEMQAIMDVELASPSHRAVRDAFCFCCATGLRVGDCSRMKWSDVHLDARTPHIAIMAKKTTKPTTVELNKYSRALIERNMDRNTDPDNTVFPFVQLCRKNLLLPQIAKAAGIKGQVRKLYFSGSRLEERMVDKADAISTHWGRHTFIVHALSIGISPAVVMQWTGHSSYDSLKPYVAIVDSTKKSSMALFDQ